MGCGGCRVAFVHSLSHGTVLPHTVTIPCVPSCVCCLPCSWGVIGMECHHREGTKGHSTSIAPAMGIRDGTVPCPQHAEMQVPA